MLCLQVKRPNNIWNKPLHILQDEYSGIKLFNQSDGWVVHLMTHNRTIISFREYERKNIYFADTAHPNNHTFIHYIHAYSHFVNQNNHVLSHNVIAVNMNRNKAPEGKTYVRNN